MDDLNKATQAFKRLDATARPRLLIVEDDPALARSFERNLRDEGDIQVCLDGEDASRALANQAFDVIISDIQLPKISGIELLRLVRAYDLDIPVILMSGDPDLKTAMEAVELGALKYLPKPLDIDELRKTVRRAVSIRRMAMAKRDALALLGVDDARPSDRAGLSGAFDRAYESLWPAFQPIVDREGHIVAYEALMRAKEPALPHPGAIVAAAEKLGRLQDLGARMRDLAASRFVEAPPKALLFVNLHPQDLLDPNLLLASAPLTKIAERVVLEITERATLENITDIQLRVRDLRNRGFRIAVDDLGAGYAGLTSFAVLEPDVVKLDMSLVRGIDTSDVRQRVVESMTGLCSDMGIKIVAEGVESAAEQSAVSALGCDWLQGYFFARPAAHFAVRTW